MKYRFDPWGRGVPTKPSDFNIGACASSPVIFLDLLMASHCNNVPLYDNNIACNAHGDDTLYYLECINYIFSDILPPSVVIRKNIVILSLTFPIGKSRSKQRILYKVIVFKCIQMLHFQMSWSDVSINIRKISHTKKTPEKLGLGLSMRLLSEQRCQIWLHKWWRHKTCRFCTTLAVSMKHSKRLRCALCKEWSDYC